MEQTQSGLRKRICFAGAVNVGKSSLMNALTENTVSLVSDIEGTTTDSVCKAYEILGLGPIVFCDTAGFGDTSELGSVREKTALQTLDCADVIVLVRVNDRKADSVSERVVEEAQKRHIPLITVFNKCDIYEAPAGEIGISAKTKTGLNKLVQELKRVLSKADEEHLLDGLIEAGQSVLLVTPIDSSAPKGRLILPQVQMIRECLDKRVLTTVVEVLDVPKAFEKQTFDLVITDSKVIHEVLSFVPVGVRVSTFSVLFAKAKGDFQIFLEGAEHIDRLQENDTVLIAESCVHTTNEDDIARTVIPKLMQKFTGKTLVFEFARGKVLPDNLSKYALIVQCGGCMLSRGEMMSRVRKSVEAGIPMTNYGLTITKCRCGSLKRLTY